MPPRKTNKSKNSETENEEKPELETIESTTELLTEEENQLTETNETETNEEPDFDLKVSDFHIPRVERPQVEAGCCPNNASHRSVKVYRTVGRKRYCKCNDCGATWTKTGSFANGLVEYASNLAKVLEQAEPVEAPNGIPVICLAVDDARSISEALREFTQV